MPFYRKINSTCDDCGANLSTKSELRRFKYRGRMFTVCADSTKTAAWNDATDAEYCLRHHKNVIDDLAQRKPELFG